MEATDSSTDSCVVYVTAPVGCADSLARTLVERRLVACVNVIPAVQSVYRWEGRVCADQEALLVIKTRLSLFERLCQVVVDEHPYDVPEVIALPIESGHAPYLEWIRQSTGELPQT